MFSLLVTFRTITIKDDFCFYMSIIVYSLIIVNSILNYSTAVSVCDTYYLYITKIVFYCYSTKSN